MTNIAKLAWTGVARESAPGTAAATPTKYLPVKKSTWSRKTKYVYQTEERGTRDGNNRRVGTVRMSQGELEGEVYVNTAPYLLVGFMGSVTSTQPDNINAPTAYSHALALADTPPGLTFFKGYDHTGYVFAYGVVSKLKFKFAADGKLLEYQASVESQYGTKISGGSYSSMTPTYADVAALAGYNPTINIDSTQSTVVQELEIDLEQKIELNYTARGNRGFLKADYGERTAKISFTARFDDSTLADAFDAEADHTMDITFLGKSLGGAISEKWSISFPVVAYDEMEVDQSKPAQQVKAKMTARPTSTKNSLFTATVVNEVASFTV